jgi:hypothetical protein
MLTARLRLLQVERIEAFGEPDVDRSEKIARLLPFPLMAPIRRRSGALRRIPVISGTCSRSADCFVYVSTIGAGDKSDWENTNRRLKLLKNRLYLGEINHKGLSYPSDHAGIIKSREPDESPPHDDAQDSDSSKFQCIVPYKVQPHKRRREIMLPANATGYGAGDPGSEQQNLLRTIAQGRAWLQEIISGDSGTQSAIAVRERKSERSIRMTLSLAFLDTAARSSKSPCKQANGKGRFSHRFIEATSWRLTRGWATWQRRQMIHFPASPRSKPPRARRASRVFVSGLCADASPDHAAGRDVVRARGCYRWRRPFVCKKRVAGGMA